jgi:sporulation protein YlmC with PRC-barrel domain
MNKDGYWAGGAGFGYGYPMDGIPTGSESNFRNVRPSYELRTLIASASILAERGQQQTCEDVLGTIRIVFKAYITQMHGDGVPIIDTPSRRQQQIVAAQPLAARSEAFRSDQLLGTEVRNPQNESLGVVHDLVLRPKTGAIAYLVIARGGFFGIDEHYVPVPWESFRVTPDLSLLVLGAHRSVMADAPQVADDAFAANGQFDQESQKVDAWWKAHLAAE